jgi:protein gp37
MRQAHWHFFELATKRAERAFTSTTELQWPKNVSFSVSIESGEYKWRMDYLKKTGATIKVISMVPLLGPMGKLDRDGIAIVGVQAETWGLKREMKPEWVEEIEEQCNRQGVIFQEETNILINEEVQCPVR